jgi:hypothetical protein
MYHVPDVAMITTIAIITTTRSNGIAATFVVNEEAVCKADFCEETAAIIENVDACDRELTAELLELVF